MTMHFKFFIFPFELLLTCTWHAIKVPGWSSTHDKALKQHFASAFSSFCLFSSPCLQPFEPFLFSPSATSFGLKAISQRNVSGPSIKPSLTPLGLDGLWWGSVQTYECLALWVAGDTGCSETRRLRWTHPCHQSVFPQNEDALEEVAETPL